MFKIMFSNICIAIYKNPIYKKGPKQDPGNYRPVSLTSQVGKVMERVIKK